MKQRTLRICPKGHRYYKSSDCLTCPECEAGNKPSDGFLARLPAPARRALLGAGLSTLQQLSAVTESEVLALHGFGKASLPVLRDELARAGLQFKG